MSVIVQILAIGTHLFEEQFSLGNGIICLPKDASQRRASRIVVRPNQEKPSHLKIEDQSHLVLANRGSQGRITPDRKRGMRYVGISPFLSIVR